MDNCLPTCSAKNANKLTPRVLRLPFNCARDNCMPGLFMTFALTAILPITRYFHISINDFHIRSIRPMICQSRLLLIDMDYSLRPPESDVFVSNDIAAAFWPDTVLYTDK